MTGNIRDRSEVREALRGLGILIWLEADHHFRLVRIDRDAELIDTEVLARLAKDSAPNRCRYCGITEPDRQLRRERVDREVPSAGVSSVFQTRGLPVIVREYLHPACKLYWSAIVSRGTAVKQREQAKLEGGER